MGIDKLFSTPKAPTPEPPVRMPDPLSPDALDAKRRTMAAGAQGGRSSTTLTQPMAPTLASGTYGGTKAGG